MFDGRMSRVNGRLARDITPQEAIKLGVVAKKL